MQPQALERVQTPRSQQASESFLQANPLNLDMICAPPPSLNFTVGQHSYPPSVLLNALSLVITTSPAPGKSN